MIAILGKENLVEEKHVLQLKKELPNEDIRFYNNYNELKDEIEEVEVILNTDPMDSNVVKNAKKLKWMMSISAGVDTYDMDLLQKMGVTLTNASGVHINQISEQIIGAMIYFSRNFMAANIAKKNKKWDHFMSLDELDGKNLLVIGTGRIGQEIAKKANAFNMNSYGIRFKDINESIPNFKNVWNIKELHDHLSNMDYIVLVVPKTDETYKMIGKEEFKLMDKNCVFLNIGRGYTVDEEAFLMP